MGADTYNWKSKGLAKSVGKERVGLRKVKVGREDRLKQYEKDKPAGRGKNYFAGRTRNVPIARAGERAHRWVRWLSSTQMERVKGNQEKKKSSKTLNLKPVGIKGGGGAKAS